jgi:hypothetical protein
MGLRWEVVAAEAWEEVLLRLTDLTRSQVERPAEMNEIPCAVRWVGPLALLGLEPKELTVGGWSNAFLQSVAPISKRTNTDTLNAPSAQPGS